MYFVYMCFSVPVLCDRLYKLFLSRKDADADIYNNHLKRDSDKNWTYIIFLYNFILFYYIIFIFLFFNIHRKNEVRSH